ncbi:putative aminopeptidase, putative,metallo-peptidase, Clan MG, Family M24 [Trypanosoma grayi]|uniref:putative aminopeptidase, putative,metallo-peptidase, Clan MG, Family M24 n=1 Tax=Trypanosoma grayi TaxID=71804 RepID=UPI0004F46790|nr:putative aminopeptidase, putative,metallo-peptidase, Clan MG, Family M24 [Trypanosoma grayi]KEG15262.1 putative aminopeptidase, putative,metallo-peptidase, Clan MG, Family M24 [Trypanosoma grayi]
MTVLTLSNARVANILSAWKNTQDPGEGCNVMCGLFGSLTPNTLENQRGQAVMQYLFSSPTVVCNVAVLFSLERLCVIHDGVSVEMPPNTDTFTYTSIRLDDNTGEELSSFLAGSTVGLCQKELTIQEGEFATKLIHLIRSIVPAERTMEVAPLLGELLFVKDESAVSCVEKAAGLCNAVFRRFARGLIEEEIQKTSPKTLSSIRDELSKKLEMPNTVKGLETLDTSQFSIASGLTTCVMHRGTYKSSIQTTEVSTQPLRGDVIVIRYGVKNCGFTAFLARTLIVEANAPPTAKEAYKFVYSISEKVIELLRVGAKLNDVYEAAMEYARTTNETLAGYLLKSLGFSTGLLVLEARGSISEKGKAVVEDGMTFVVRVVLEGVVDGSGETFDVELSDTVTVNGGGAQLNTKTSRKVEEILYEGDAQEEAFNIATRDLHKITRQGQSSVPLLSRESARDEKLRSLLRELHTELIAAGGKKATSTATEELRVYEVGRVSYGDVIPYPKESSFPPQARNGIYVHVDKEVVFFPVCNGVAAFHAVTINKVDIKPEGEYVTCTFTFHSLQEANVAYRLNRTKIFVKELSYRAPRDVFTEVKIAIQGIHQRIKNRDTERRRASASAGGSKLSVTPNPLRLPQIKIRPTATTGRQNKDCIGNLELHQNGLRFSYIGGSPIDLLFDNMKHVIFQPAVNAIRVIYHITLKKGIEIARKNVDEVQFVADVMESSEGVTGARRSYTEEIAAEEREQMRISETNKQFMRFAQAVEKMSNMKTQIPVSNFSFDGVHAKGLTTFKANREVLWAISDRPPFTQRVADIEVVSLERVIPGGSTFDMSLIFKDYSKPAVTITTIPRSSLEAIKDWCLAARLYYMETTVNPNWKVVLKTILDDAEWDPWRPGAGWAVLNNDNDGDEEEEGDEETDSDDSTYNEEEDEETDETGSSFLEDDEESEPDNSDGDDDESALSWDEMERRAEAHDRKRGYESDDDDERPRKKPHVANTARAAPLPTRGKAPRMPNPGSAVPPPRRF